MAPEPADPAEPNRHRLSPKKPHSARSAKPVCQTNPIPTASDNALAPASDRALAPATGRPSPPVTPKNPTQPKAPKSSYQTDPISPDPSKSTSDGHLPLTESRISPAAAAIENHRSADLKETCGFSGLPNY